MVKPNSPSKLAEMSICGGDKITHVLRVLILSIDQWGQNSFEVSRGKPDRSLYFP